MLTLAFLSLGECPTVSGTERPNKVTRDSHTHWPAQTQPLHGRLLSCAHFLSYLFYFILFYFILFYFILFIFKQSRVCSENPGHPPHLRSLSQHLLKVCCVPVTVPGPESGPCRRGLFQKCFFYKECLYNFLNDHL